MARPKVRTEQLNVRVTPEEKVTIQTAAQEMETTVTDLMVTATIDKINDKGRKFKGTLRRMREAGLV